MARPVSASKIRAGLAVVVAVVLLLLLWTNSIRPNLIPKRFGVVEAGEVYRSGKLTAAATRKVVREHDIRTIVDLGAYEEGSKGDRRAARTAAALGVDRVRISGVIGDSTGNPNAYVEALRIMSDPQRRPVLVHCGAGSERTGCVVALYDHIVRGMPMDEAYELTTDFGHNPGRNPHLRQTLDTWVGPVSEALAQGRSVPGQDPVELVWTSEGAEDGSGPDR